MSRRVVSCLSAALAAVFLLTPSASSDEKKPAAKADEKAPPLVEGKGEGWRELGEKDFVTVNGDKDTWAWKDGLFKCTGKPVGVCRYKEQVTNFELVLEWRHNKRSGNSGVFVWVPDASLAKLKPNQLPTGMEVQILDHGYTEDVKKRGGKTDWFTSNGDVFRVGPTKFKPFPPTSPDGSRSFPKKNTTKGFGEWNHYYIKAIDGEIRLWVNGTEVSGGNGCDPKTGHLCLESEGSPIDFKNIRLKVLK